MGIKRRGYIRNTSQLRNAAFSQKAYRGVDCKNNSFHVVRIPKMEGENYLQKGEIAIVMINDESLQILAA